MNAYRVWELQPVDDVYALQIAERPWTNPGPSDVVIKVAAVSLNYRDLIVQKKLGGRDAGGRIPVSDGAGEVVAIGADVHRWKIGDRVAGCFFQTWQQGRFAMGHHRHDLGGTIDGMLAEYVTLSEEGVVAAPGNLTFNEVACLPCAGLTAWSALVVRGQIQPGDTVLAIGTGGVSMFALQIATALGARVIVTSRHAAKLKLAAELGAWKTIDSTAFPEWFRQVSELTDGRGVDHVVEVGGPGTLAQSVQAVAAGGHVALIGVLTGFGPAQGSLFPLVTRNADLHGIYVGSREEFERFNLFVEQYDLHPVIDRTFPFNDAPAAYEALASGNHVGKITIEVSAAVDARELPAAGSQIA